MNPKVSVILPVWNGEKYINRSIISIRSQTFENFECIIVNDGSTDQTIEAINDNIIGDKRFRILDIPHSGLSVARNTGIDAANGEVIFHIDSDDEAMPQMIEKSIEFLDENDLEIAFFNAISTFEGNIIPLEKALNRYFNRKMTYGIHSGRDMLDQMTLNGDYVYAVFIQAAKKSAIRKKFFPQLRAQDMLYTTQNLFLANRVGHLSDFLYIKNTNLNSISLSRLDASYAWSLLKIILELQKFAEEECSIKSIGLERVVDQAFQALIYAIKNLNEDDWKNVMKMSFTEKTFLAAIARIVYAPAVKKRLEQYMPSEWQWFCQNIAK